MYRGITRDSGITIEIVVVYSDSGLSIVTVVSVVVVIVASGASDCVSGSGVNDGKGVLIDTFRGMDDVAIAIG